MNQGLKLQWQEEFEKADVQTVRQMLRSRTAIGQCAGEAKQSNRAAVGTVIRRQHQAQ